MLQVSRSAVYHWIRLGRLHVGQLPSGRYARITAAEVARVLDEAKVRPGEQA